MRVRLNRARRKAMTVALGLALSVIPVTSAAAAPAQTEGHPGVQFKAFEMVFDVGNLSNTNECIASWVTASYYDPIAGVNANTKLVRTNNNGCETDPTHLQKYGDFQNTYSKVYLQGGPAPTSHIFWDDLTTMTLTVTTPNTPPGRQKNVRITHATIIGIGVDNNRYQLFDEPYAYVFHDYANDAPITIRH